MKGLACALAFVPALANAQTITPPAPSTADITPPHRITTGGCSASYPSRRVQENAGTTVITFKVEPDGTTKDVVVIQSSGSDDLDQSVIKCFEGARYSPALQDGVPVEYAAKLAVKWHSK
jgi:protein TonB